MNNIKLKEIPVQILNLKPDSIIILKFPPNINESGMHNVITKVKSQFPNNKIIGFANGIELEIIDNEI